MSETRLLFLEAVEIADVLNIDVRLIDPRAALLRAPRHRAPNRLGRPGRQLQLALAWEPQPQSAEPLQRRWRAGVGTPPRPDHG